MGLQGIYSHDDGEIDNNLFNISVSFSIKKITLALRIDTLRGDRYLVDIGILHHVPPKMGEIAHWGWSWRFRIKLVANDLTLDEDWRVIANR